MKTGRKRHKIAVIMASMSDEYSYETLRGIVEEARLQQTDIYIFNANASTDETIKHNIGEYNIYNLINYAMFDGVILFANLIQSNAVYNSVIGQIRESGVITVSIDSEIEGFYFVGVENYRPMKRIVEHLIVKHHYTKINIVCGQDFNSDNRERLKAYCDALQEHGIPVEESRISRGAFTNLHGREAAGKMLENPKEFPQAVVCATDNIAIGVKSVFSGRGIQIPQQVALTGFDNIFESQNSLPGITTVDRNQSQAGREAVRRIAARLRGEEVPLRKRLSAAPIFRESCGCCSKEEDDIVSVREKYLEKEEQYGRYLYDSTIMIEDLNDSKSLEDLGNRLINHIGRLACDNFYLCMDKELVEDLRSAEKENAGGKFSGNYRVEGYPGTMSVVLAYENGKRVHYEDFPSGQMLPSLPAEGNGNHIYVFAPLHFRDRCMGYVVVENSRLASSSPIFSTWLINLSNGIETLRKQAHLKSMVERLDRMYVVDQLTGLFNRLGFARYTEESFQRCREQKISFMILFADLDGLKGINDRFGHDCGDETITVVAGALQNACRGGEICARFGGDEFVVYAAGYTQEDAESYCRRLDELLERANRELGRPYRIGASYGYGVVIPKDGEELSAYVEMADNRMYSHKKNRRKD